MNAGAVAEQLRLQQRALTETQAETRAVTMLEKCAGGDVEGWHKHTPSAAASDLLAVANTSDRRLEDASAACVWVWVCVGSAASVCVCVCLDEGESAYACHVRDVCRPSFASLARFFSLDASSVVKTEACFAPAAVVRARLRWHDPARVSPDIARYCSDPVDRPFFNPKST